MQKPAKERELHHYEQGAAAYRACRVDPRFGYFLYFPDGYSPAQGDRYALCVIIHGSARTPHIYRDLFADFAGRNNCVILAPMFPVGITDPEDMGSYKFLMAGDLRYDRVLLAMVDEVRTRYGLPSTRFLMHGFSGGAHFAHRFYYLHPKRLLGLSIGAPGMVTLLDDTLDWHCGVRGMAERFDVSIDREAMRAVPVQMVIGAEDTETWEITIEPGSRYWMPGVNDAGVTRLERLEALRQSFVNAGIEVRFDAVPGVGHEGYRILEPVKGFFAAILERGHQTTVESVNV